MDDQKLGKGVQKLKMRENEGFQILNSLSFKTFKYAAPSAE